MADTHIQINLDGSTEERKTVLWPSDKIGQEKVIRSLFTQKYYPTVWRFFRKPKARPFISKARCHTFAPAR